MRFVAEIEEVPKPLDRSAYPRSGEKNRKTNCIKRYETIPGLRDADLGQSVAGRAGAKAARTSRVRQINMEMTRRAHGTRTHVDQEWAFGRFMAARPVGDNAQTGEASSSGPAFCRPG